MFQKFSSESTFASQEEVGAAGKSNFTNFHIPNNSRLDAKAQSEEKYARGVYIGLKEQNRIKTNIFAAWASSSYPCTDMYTFATLAKCTNAQMHRTGTRRNSRRDLRNTRE